MNIGQSKRIVKTLLYDTRNRLRYGRAAPYKNQLLWVDPAAIESQIDFKKYDFQREMLGEEFPYVSLQNRESRARAALRSAPDMVLWSDFDLYVCPLSKHDTYRAVYGMFDNGLDWEAAGFYDRMVERAEKGLYNDGASTWDDIISRYDNLDSLVDLMRSGKSYDPPPSGLARYVGVDGVSVAISRQGEIIFAHSGAHRLSLSKYFRLAHIPVNVCAVHGEAIRSGAWDKIRTRQALSAFT